jgi:hypothetical protein
MIGARFQVSTLLKLTLVSACAAMVILWPTWRVALQTLGYYQEGRMTGGGGCTTTDLGTGKEIQVSHGFELHCDPNEEPNNLEVNWRVEGETGSHRFHLDVLTSADCSDQPGYDEGKPVAGFDTYSGEGTGSYDGVADATAGWTLTDKGEPGKNDTFDIVIRDAEGNTVLSISCTPLSGGNHQAHPNE